MNLKPATYNYPFICELPFDLPTSLEGNHGHVRYTVSVILDRPMWPDQKFEEPFTVIRPVDLNEHMELKVYDNNFHM